MAILAIIAVIALGGYAYGFIKTRELSALRKEMKLYVDRMEAAELVNAKIIGRFSPFLMSAIGH